MSKKYERLWGWYTLLYDDDHSNHKVKKMFINPGGKIPLQSHNDRSEHLVVVNGKANVIVNNIINTIQPNEYIYIPQKAPHSIENNEANLLEIIVTLHGNYLGEDDIVRY
jgi:mannose-6-phosphate isomerase-like protein (cupin superfamily)